MELQQSTPAVEEEHNISLKDSSKKLIRNPITPLLLHEKKKKLSWYYTSSTEEKIFSKYNLYLDLVCTT